MNIAFTTVADPVVTPGDVQRDRILGYIEDAIAVESAAIALLKDALADAQETEDAALYRAHLAETESQKARLETHLHTLGGKASRNVVKDLIKTVGAMATDLLHVGHTPHEKATRHLIQAYAVENFEVAVYESLHHAALEIGDTATAQLAATIQAEEKATAEKVWQRIGHSARLGIVAPQ